MSLVILVIFFIFIVVYMSLKFWDLVERVGGEKKGCRVRLGVGVSKGIGSPVADVEMLKKISDLEYIWEVESRRFLESYQFDWQEPEYRELGNWKCRSRRDPEWVRDLCFSEEDLEWEEDSDEEWEESVVIYDRFGRGREVLLR